MFIKRNTPWFILFIGFLIWVGVQGALVNIPLWTRALPPEIDDSLTYVLKTVQMRECFSQDCPALIDLRVQGGVPGITPEVLDQLYLSGSRIFPIYHPLLSAFFIGLEQFGWDPMTVYKLVWAGGPILFGVGFAYLLVSLFGMPAAGIALGLLAFKIFPDTGLHHIVPSNITMAFACILFSRIISKKGDALWSMLFWSLVLIGMHPVGRIYAVIAVILALILSEPGSKARKKTCLALGVLSVVLIVAFLSASLLKNPSLVKFSFFPEGADNPLLGVLIGAAQSFGAVMIENIRLGASLYGIFPIFLSAVVFGLFSLPDEDRRIVLKVFLCYSGCVLASFFYVSSHPADVILRIWIPLVVILFGAVGQCLWFLTTHSWIFLKETFQTQPGTFSWKKHNGAWVLIGLSVMIGYVCHMIVTGGEHIAITIKHLQDREPLAFDPMQPSILLSQAKPEDRVVYTSMIIMPYYFIHGTMKLRALYYHPVMEGTPSVQCFDKPDIHFVVGYNPLVYHPSFEGLNETDWWVRSPHYRFSELSMPRGNSPLLKEGSIPAANFRWIDVEPHGNDFPNVVKILIKNSGRKSWLTLQALDASGTPDPQNTIRIAIPADSTQWIESKTDIFQQGKRFRIRFPQNGKVNYSIGGIRFSDEKLNWPWAEKASLTFMPSGDVEPITRSFNPSLLLPPSLRGHFATVLDDRGSSVLVRIDR